jgi:hypothetical protein
MTDQSTSLKPRPAPLPARAEDWHRQIKAERTLNDLVEDIHNMLREDGDYLRYLYAVYDEQAVEGSLSADNLELAAMIRDKAKQLGNTEIASQKKATLVKALNVVTKRYGQSRKQRRNRIGGEVVADDDNNGM